MVHEERKTGDFHARAAIGPEAPEREREWARSGLLRTVAGQLERSSEDGREYVVFMQIGKWERRREYGPEVSEVLPVDFGVYVADASAAEVGEHVLDLPVSVPDDEGRVKLGLGFGVASGYVFERASELVGWKRIE